MSSSGLLSLIGWTFLPNQIAGWLQSIYYGITIRAGEQRPIPGTQRYVIHRRRIQMIVIVLYLAFTIFEADWQLRREGDFYTTLGVLPNADERAIQSRFRKLTILHHPDKATTAEAQSAAESYFVTLKLARDTLTDSARRFAYDRFGPEVIEWRHCTTVRDYVFAGVRRTIPFYVSVGLGMLALGFFGYLEWGKYWRYVTFAAICALEVHIITRPILPRLITRLVNPVVNTMSGRSPYLPFQVLQLARKIAFTVFIALSQLGPLLHEPTATGQLNSDALQQRQLNRLANAVKLADQETVRLLSLDVTPFSADEQGMQALRNGLQEWLVQNTIRSDPTVRDAVGRALVKRRQGAPAGARGTR
ncbi:membrane associated DnaJ chaperone-like protein [Viridothelium virens]|uniref:Membrane associated DnaJ chaperone-like protein n=1 Tax=Viridothelium virens TaxID=1048519 RepID=A0A6A6H894_VIRVR|nr:membrane associated DnaJ chaperone-like protein [Viridothelium virens]